MAITYLLSERRKQRDREAWADPQHAAHADQQPDDAADPAVRLMNEAEHDHWQSLERGPSAPASRTGAGPDRTLTVRIAPMGTRWGLHAHTQASDADRAVGEATLALSCADEATATALADELLADGPGGSKLERLRIAAATQRADTDVSEPEEHRVARARDAVWAAFAAPLAQRITTAEAFRALAWELFKLENRGYAMSDILGRLDQRVLSAGRVRDPAALAHFLVARLAATLPVVDLGGSAPPDLAKPVAAQPATAPPRLARDRPTAHPGDGPLDEHRALERQLARALPAEMCQRLSVSHAYPELLDRLEELSRHAGRVDALLERPQLVAKLHGARDPARYLSSVARREAAPPHDPSLVDREVMAALVRDALREQPALAERLTTCEAFPALARELNSLIAAGASRDQVAETLRGLPPARIELADTPAAYASVLLRKRASDKATRENGGSLRTHDAAPTAQSQAEATERLDAHEHIAPDAGASGQATGDRGLLDAYLASVGRAIAADRDGAASVAAHKAEVTFTPPPDAPPSPSSGPGSVQPIPRTARAPRPAVPHRTPRQ
jgi:hypothetical protein